MSSKIWENPFDIKKLKIFRDERGALFEILRYMDDAIPNEGQLYTFTILPGKRRGDHYHRKKREWFTCVYGKATVLLTSQDDRSKAVILSSQSPSVVYVGPGTAHALLNNAQETAVIVSYGSCQHDPNDEDLCQKEAYKGFHPDRLER